MFSDESTFRLVNPRAQRVRRSSLMNQYLNKFTVREDLPTRPAWPYIEVTPYTVQYTVYGKLYTNPSHSHSTS